MALNIENIPPNAVQVLFAEDLINRVLYRHNGTQYEAWRAGPYRNFIFNAFNDDVKIAVDFIDMSLEWEMDDEFSKLVDNFDVNEKAFVDYALYYEQLYFQKGFTADYFLSYCVRLVSMAAYLAQYNVPVAPHLALYFILKVLEGHDMLRGGWDTLHIVAKKYVRMNEDFFSVLTPEDSEDEPALNSADEDDDEEVFHGYISYKDYFAANQLQTGEEKPEFKTKESSAPENGLEPEIHSESASKMEPNSGQDLERLTSSKELVRGTVEAAGVSLNAKWND